MPEPRHVGTAAEDRAAEFLLGKGMTLLTRRYKAAGGELDLVALDGERLVFVEVKARRTVNAALESITPNKIKRLVAAADHFARESGIEAEWRFDVVVVGPERLAHFPGAFQAW